MSTRGILRIHGILLAVAHTLWLFSGCADTAYSTSYEFSSPIERVVVDVAIGDVVVKATDGDESRVDIDVECRVAVPDVDVTLEGRVLSVKMFGGMGGASDCRGHFEIEIPVSAAVFVTTESGDVAASGVSGEVRLTSFKGNISLDTLSGPMEVQAASGTVIGSGLRGSVGRFYVGNGDVDLVYETTPSSVDVDMILGDAKLTVPQNVYNISADTLEGIVDIKGLTSAPEATRLLWLAIDTGDIRIAGTPSLFD